MANKKFYISDCRDLFLESFDKSGCSFSAFSNDAKSYATLTGAKRIADKINTRYGYKKVFVNMIIF